MRETRVESLTRGVPRLWVHGTLDANVAPAITRHYWEMASEPKSVLWVVGSEHMFDVARGAAYEPLKDWLAQTATTQAMAGTGAGAAPFATDQADKCRMTWLTTGAHVSVMPMRAPCYPVPAVPVMMKNIIINNKKKNASSSSFSSGGGGGGVHASTAARGWGVGRSSWSRNIILPLKPSKTAQQASTVVVSGLTKKSQPPAGIGAGWVDVSAALGEGHAEAAAHINNLVKPMSIEKLLKNPNAKGYSE